MKTDQTPATPTPSLTRRHFLKSSSIVVAGASLASSGPFVLSGRAAPDAAINVGLIGCGARGTAAVQNALAAAPNVKTLALADLFPDRLDHCRAQLKRGDVTLRDDLCFSGFDAYQKLLAVSEVNYVILAAPPHFRPSHARAAIDAGKHVFMEAPVAVDSPGVRTIMETGEVAKSKKLVIGAGLQRRFLPSYRETIQRLQDGAIDRLLVGRAFWNQGGLWLKPRLPGWTDSEWQLRNWPYFTWLSGDQIVEQLVHNLDIINWVLKGHPTKASGIGGRQVRTGPEYGNVYDHFNVEYEYPGGIRVFGACRQIEGGESNIGEAVIGATGVSNCRDSIQVRGEKAWSHADKDPDPFVREQTEVIAAIREEKPLNQASSAAESTLTAILGRMAAYSGHSVPWDTALNSTVDLSPAKYEFGPLPVAEVALPGRDKIKYY